METEGVITGAKARGLNNLKLAPLRSREERGTKKEYEEFLEKMDNHVSVNWDFGGDVAYVIKNNKEPKFEEPVDLSEENEKVKWKVMLWEQQVNRYGHRVTTLVHNLEALYSMIFEKLTKIMKAKVQSKMGFLNAGKEKGAIWLLQTIEDIVLNFEETKPIDIALDDQMEVITNLRQEKMMNEDFVKIVSKEMKVYKKYRGKYLWGKVHEKKSSMK